MKNKKKIIKMIPRLILENQKIKTPEDWYIDYIDGFAIEMTINRIYIYDENSGEPIIDINLN